MFGTEQVYFTQYAIKTSLNVKTIKEKELPENNYSHLFKDEVIELTGAASKKKYPKQLRHLAIWDEKNEQVIELITNHMPWSANAISQRYKSRS